MQRIGAHEKSFNKMVNTINNSLDLDSNEQLSYSKQIGFEGFNVSFREKGNVYIKVHTAILRHYGINKAMGCVLWYFFQSLSLNNNSKGVFYGSTLKLANRINLVLKKIGVEPISFTSIYRAVKILQKLNLIEYNTKVKYKNGKYTSFSKITFNNNVIQNLCENLEQSKLNNYPPNLLQRIIKYESITFYQNKKDDINDNWKNAFEGLLD